MSDLNVHRYLALPIKALEIEPVTLVGKSVILRPLQLEDHAGLCQVGLAPELWQWTKTQVTTPAEMLAYMEAALAAQRQGSMLPFVIVEQATQQIVGSTRYLSIERKDLHVEIGYSWVAPAWQRTIINTESKYLLLAHAFEKLGCLRVEFKTDLHNLRSQQAIARLGAEREGVFRNHIIAETGRVRHSVYYSIIDSDWPKIKANLLAKLNQ